jgi:sec-independent protein translocase protein TatA
LPPLGGIWVNSYRLERVNNQLAMAIVGYEAIVIGIIVVVIFIWGPNKIPEIAKGLGRARREFDEASKGLTSGSTILPRIDASASDPLTDTAQKLGINTTGKTRQEISDEIVRVAQTKS